jgi:hypothetical protein
MGVERKNFAVDAGGGGGGGGGGGAEKGVIRSW